MYQKQMNRILKELLSWYIDPNMMQEMCSESSKGERTMNDAFTIFVKIIETNQKG